MGRDRHDRISTATYLDVSNTLRVLEAEHDTITQVQILTDPQGTGLHVIASVTVWGNPNMRKDFTVSRYCGMNTPPLASVIYQVVTRLYHDVDAWVQRAPRRERAGH